MGLIGMGEGNVLHTPFGWPALVCPEDEPEEDEDEDEDEDEVLAPPPHPARARQITTTTDANTRFFRFAFISIRFSIKNAGCEFECVSAVEVEILIPPPLSPPARC
jgi:hypothetical protein